MAVGAGFLVSFFSFESGALMGYATFSNMAGTWLVLCSSAGSCSHTGSDEAYESVISSMPS